MVDWTKPMKQTFEYYTVDPGTWKDDKKLDTVVSCTISRDSDVETLGSATFEVVDSLSECYVRVYLITIQNGITEKHPLGTFLVQTPTVSFNGKKTDISIDAYTPLLELKENPTPLGYSILKDSNIMENAYLIMRERMRAPIVKATCDETLYSDFVSNTDDTWMTFLTDLIANAKYEFDLDELGRVLYSPKQNIESLQPAYTFDDGNSSILYPEITFKHDLYGIPNVVEVICRTSTGIFSARVVNDDPNSPTSTVNRGREIVCRDTAPQLSGDPTQIMIDEYAEQLLKNLSTVEYTLTFTHGYYPVRLRDCVRLNYKRAGITDIKARVTNQSIKCIPGCPVSTTATFTTKLWR